MAGSQLTMYPAVTIVPLILVILVKVCKIGQLHTLEFKDWHFVGTKTEEPNPTQKHRIVEFPRPLHPTKTELKDPHLKQRTPPPVKEWSI